MNQQNHLPRWVAMALLALLLGVPGFAQQWKANPRELVRQAVANEDKQPAEEMYFLYRDVKRKKDGSTETKEILQTPQLVLGRVVAINGKPLDATQRKNEEARLNRLLNNPDELQKKKKEQQADDARARRMVRAIPDAFNFQYVGSEQGPLGEIAVLHFTPNPNWDPPTRELQVFTGMEGTMKIALQQEHLVEMNARLEQDVNFGWGILGRLYKGGTFLIRESEIAPNHWDVTHMKLHFTGKVLLFKSLNIQQDESTSDYRQVPQMTVAQALDKLRELDTEYAKNANGEGQ